MRRSAADVARKSAPKPARDLFDLGIGPMLVIDLTTGRIRDANRDACRLVGTTRARLLRRHIDALFERADGATAAPSLRWAAERSEADVRDLALRPSSGAPFPVHVKARKARLDGSTLLFVSLQDQRVEAEAEVALQRQRDHRNTADRLSALAHMIGGIAHEMNNPLAVVVGLSQLLLHEPELEGFRGDLQAIAESADRCHRIMQKLMRFSGLHDHEVTLVPLSDVVRRAANAVASQCRSAGISLEVDVEPSLPQVWGDARLLEEVLLNILYNAREAIEDAREGSRIRLMGDTVDGVARVRVANDGPPIPENMRNRIFDPFFTTKEVGRGTGLGLSHCYGVVQEHQGEIRVTTLESGETEFCIQLPVATAIEPPIPAPPSRPEPPRDAGRIHGVLCIVENPSERAILRRSMFGESRIHPTAASSLAEGMEQIRTLGHDIVIVSSDLDPEAARRLTTRLRGVTPSSPPRVIAIVEPGATADPLGSGFDALVERPIVAERVLETVLSLLGLH